MKTYFESLRRTKINDQQTPNSICPHFGSINFCLLLICTWIVSRVLFRHIYTLTCSPFIALPTASQISYPTIPVVITFGLEQIARTSEYRWSLEKFIHWRLSAGKSQWRSIGTLICRPKARYQFTLTTVCITNLNLSDNVMWRALRGHLTLNCYLFHTTDYWTN